MQVGALTNLQNALDWNVCLSVVVNTKQRTSDVRNVGNVANGSSRSTA